MNAPDRLRTQSGAFYVILDNSATGPQVLVQLLETQAGQFIQRDVADIRDQMFLQEVGVLLLGWDGTILTVFFWKGEER